MLFRIGTFLALLLLLFSGEVRAGTEAKPDVLTGHLSYVFTERKSGPEVEWYLQSGGKPVRLDLPASIVASAGGFIGLREKNVHVSGRSFGDVFRVDRIGWLPDGPSNRHGQDAEVAIPQSIASPSKPQIFVLAKFADVSTVPHPKSWYETFVFGAAPSLNDYWKEQSNGQWSLDGSIVLDWITLPKTRAQYADSSPVGVNYQAVWNDVIAAIDPQIDFRQYGGFHVILNANVGNNLGGVGGEWWRTLDGETRYWGSTYDNLTLDPLYLLAHEMGHTFGFDHSSGPYAATYDSRWDQMSDGANPSRQTPEYGAYPVHTNAYHRIVTGIIPRDQISECGAGANRTVRLTRLVQPVAGYMQAARVYLGGDGGHWLTVEARKRIGTYENGVTLPYEGVVIHDCDATHMKADPFSGVVTAGPVSQVLDVDNNGNCNDEGAVWTVGETYTDAAHGVTISVVRDNGPGYDVKIVVDPNQPSPMIVTNGNDHGPGSLRSALSYANLFPATIKFAAPTSALTNGELVVRPVTPLPSITAAKVTVDGSTQTDLGDTVVGMPEVAIDGSAISGYGNGLRIEGSKALVRGISVRKFPTVGFSIFGADDAVIDACTAGLDRTGKVAAPNGWGLSIEYGSDRALIRDLLASGNLNNGIAVSDGTALKILGGRFGTDRTGSLAVPNRYENLWASNYQGVEIAAYDGRYALFSAATDGNGMYFNKCTDLKMTNPRVGTDSPGRKKLGNRYSGIWFNDCAGITVANALIAGNTGNGIYMTGNGPANASFTSCYIGTDATVAAPLPNASGAWIDQPGVNFSGCIVSGNNDSGIVYAERGNGTVKSCKLGTNKAGTAAVPNGRYGLGFQGSNGWTASGCVIASNGYGGIIAYSGAQNGLIASCKIGTGVSGQALVSPGTGVWLENSSAVKLSSNTIANAVGSGAVLVNASQCTVVGGKIFACADRGIGLWSGSKNCLVDSVDIRNCVNQGVGLAGADTQLNTVKRVTSDSNGWGGIALWDSAHHNRVENNVLLNYTGCGLSFSEGAHDNTAVTNAVGCTKAAPTVAVHSGWGGIGAWSGAANNQIGQIGAGNVVAGGSQIGVYVADETTLGNAIRGNAIYATTNLGIDLGGNGATPNDPSDADTGPNRLQNSPVLTKGATTGLIDISYQGAANRIILVDLYAANANGSGVTFLGTVNLNTSASGAATASFGVPAGTTKVTAVATDSATGDSSEFAAGVTL